MTRDEAWQLVCDWVPNPNLRKHMLAVEAAMRVYAKKFGEDQEQWGLAGLLHDADWEQYPDEHPQRLLAELRSRHVDPAIIQAINAHGGKDSVPRQSQFDTALFACDEITGFIVAVALLCPGKFDDVTPEKVIKKLKKKDFAKGVNRDDVSTGAEELGITLADHIRTVIEAMKGIRHDLGL